VLKAVPFESRHKRDILDQRVAQSSSTWRTICGIPHELSSEVGHAKDVVFGRNDNELLDI
jgi:hypothetical protein